MYTKDVEDNSWFKKDIALPAISVANMMLIILISMIFVIGVTVWLADDPNWARWHISYLGEGDKFSAHFFNVSMWFLALLIFTLAILFGKDLENSKQSKSTLAKIQPKIVTTGLIIMSLCVYLIGLFPRSYGIFPHDIFGHIIYFVFLGLCAGSPWILPGMPRWFYTLSYGFHAAILCLFIAYWTGLSKSLYLAEVATFIFFFLWMTVLVREGRSNG